MREFRLYILNYYTVLPYVMPNTLLNNVGISSKFQTRKINYFLINLIPYTLQRSLLYLKLSSFNCLNLAHALLTNITSIMKALNKV